MKVNLNKYFERNFKNTFAKAKEKIKICLANNIYTYVWKTAKFYLCL